MSPISHEMTSQFNDLSKSLNALMSEKNQSVHGCEQERSVQNVGSAHS